VILLVRHGQTTSNAARLLVGRSDPPLTELGERQAIALRPLLTNVREVWSSPLRRATATATLAFPATPAVIKESFIELDYGTFDGKELSAMSTEEWQRCASDHAAPFGGGESLQSLDQRVHRELETLLENRSSLLHRDDEHLAIVTHMSPVKSATVWALGVAGPVTWRMQLRNGSITTIGTRGSTPILVNYNVLGLAD
jgi:broad specificity phosphatase PhoE